MTNLDGKAVYRLNCDCGRQGYLSGIFIAKKNHMKIFQDNKIEVYFGEVLGKHSEICGLIEENEIELISDNQVVIDVIEKHNLENGFNPFEYEVFRPTREDFDGLTIQEAVEVLEQENLTK